MKAVTPESIFPDGPDTVPINNVQMRKGVVASCIFNVKVLESNCEEEEKKKALETIQSIAPDLQRSMEFSKYLTWNNKQIQEIFEAAARN